MHLPGTKLASDGNRPRDAMIDAVVSYLPID